MTDLRTIVDAMLAERSRSLGVVYPAGTADRLIDAAEAARQRTAHLDGKRIAGIQAMEAELALVERRIA